MKVPSKFHKILRDIVPPLLVRAVRRCASLYGGAVVENSELYLKHCRINSECRPGEIVLRPGLKLRLSPDSVRPFEFFCYISEEMVLELDCFLALATNRTRLLDVGALHGLFSLAFTANNQEASALAIDPSPTAYSTLLYNIHKNPKSRIVPLEIALSDREETLPMFFEWQHLRAVSKGGECNSKRIEVPALRGDVVCEREKFTPDLIKIDVEGFEYKCLCGLENIIQKHRPAVLLEVHPSMMADYGNSVAQLWDFFNDRGYSFFALDNSVMERNAVLGMTEVRRVMVQAQTSDDDQAFLES